MTHRLILDIPAGLPWIDFTRDFDAAVEQLFEAHRNPDLVAQWLGPRGYEMVIDHYDLVTGGSYRYVHRNPEGAEFGFHGSFHTVRTNEIVVQTFEFDGAPDEAAIEFLRFTALDGGGCRLQGRSVGRTVEGRDAMVASGMEQGMVQSYERLEELLQRRSTLAAGLDPLVQG